MPAPSHPRRIPRLRWFLRQQSGTVTVFATMMFVLMIGVGGIAVDVMRYETQRTRLQNTLDRAILAAASLSQQQNPRDVVNAYFDAAGLQRYRLRVNVEEGLNYRRVSATAEMEVETMFMRLFGVRVLTSPAVGVAEERLPEIEISMVLDISGSMGSYNRMVNMRPAARDFVTAMLAPNVNEEGINYVSISIVPYEGMVNAGDTIESVFTLSDEHAESSCVRFAAADFLTTAIAPSSPLERLAHWDRSGRNSDREFRDPHCRTDNYAAILPWEHRESVLHAHIDSLSAQGWTAIDLGMTWAVGLLDPAAQPAASALAAAGVIDAQFADRPSIFNDNETLKVVVLMTDGENTYQYDLLQPYKRGESIIYHHAADDRWSIWWEDRGSAGQFWIPDGAPYHYSGTWSDTPYRGAESQPLDWTWLWANYTARFISEEWLRVPAYMSGQWNTFNHLRYASTETYADGADADANLRAICDAARAQGIIVFAIGFEAPAGGQAVMQYCATSAAHYYDVEGIEISDAFRSIARAINRLRLIQ